MIEVEDLSLRRDGREVLRLPRLSLGAEGLTAILGHNGSGKSTLLSALARQLRPEAGRIRLEGADISALGQRALARRLAFLPQRTPETAGLTVRELVGLGRYPWRGALGRWRAEDDAAVDRAMAWTGVADFAPRLADELSGGERQRAFIALLLAQEAPLLLLDEPTSALDLAHQIEALSLFRRLSREGRRVVVVLHDLNLAARYADRVLVLRRGELAFDGPPAELMSPERLAALYGLPLDVLSHPGGPVAVPA